MLCSGRFSGRNPLEVKIMVFKLLKYDFKSMLRVFIPLWLALLAVSAINHFSVSATSSYADSLIWDMKAIAMLVFFGLIIAAGVLTAVLVIQRFYLGLLKDEGYLMFTLPVKPWQLLTSKVVSALVVCALSLGVGVLSVMILGYQMEDYQRMFSGLGTTIQTYPESFIALLVLGLAYAFAAITQIYVSLALGHLANRHRIAWAVGVYIAIQTVLSWVFTNSWDPLRVMLWGTSYPVFLDVGRFNQLLWIMAGIYLVLGGIFFLVTERILSKKLNLE